eukprot:5314742-Prymnesium_polylepis.2
MVGCASCRTNHSGVRQRWRGRMKWEVPKVSGTAPSPRGACTSVLAGHRLFIYGGVTDLDGPPSDELWVLDLELVRDCSARLACASFTVRD